MDAAESEGGKGGGRLMRIGVAGQERTKQRNRFTPNIECMLSINTSIQ
jgi:hypothetical protein